MSNAERLSPHDLDAERAILGAILVANDRLHDIGELVAPGDFFRVAHRTIYEAMRGLSERRQAIDYRTVAAALTSKALDDVGGPVYIASLTDGLPRASHVADYCRIVKEASLRRRLQAIATRAIAEAGDEEVSAQEAVERAEGALYVLGQTNRSARAAAMAAREFSTAGEIYRYTLPEWGLLFELEQIRRTPWGELTGELAVYRQDEKRIFRGSLNVSSGDKRERIAQQIAKRAGMPEVDWPGVFEDFCGRCLEAEREGRPGTWLHEVEPRESGRIVRVLHGMDLPVELSSCLFGDGDTGKSYLALSIIGELSQAGLTCGIVDGEMEDSIHAGRLRALFGTHLPRVAHIRADRPLAMQVDAVRRWVRDRKLNFLIYDSVGFLTPDPEKAESALAYMRAVRQVGTGSLSTAHVVKSREVKPQDQKPFGSNFYYQQFRGVWYVQAESDPDSDGRKAIAVWDRKGSVKGKRPPYGIALTVRSGFASVEAAELSDTPELSEQLPLWRQLKGVLASGPADIDDLAEAVGKPPATIKTTLYRLKQVFAMTEIGGRNLWALTSRNDH